MCLILKSVIFRAATAGFFDRVFRLCLFEFFEDYLVGVEAQLCGEKVAVAQDVRQLFPYEIRVCVGVPLNAFKKLACLDRDALDQILCRVKLLPITVGDHCFKGLTDSWFRHARSLWMVGVDERVTPDLKLRPKSRMELGPIALRIDDLLRVTAAADRICACS